MLTQAQTAPKHLKWKITILPPPPPQTMFMCCFNTKLLPILAQKVKTFCKFYRWHWQLEGWVISGDKCAERYGVPLHLHNQIWPSLEEGCWKSDAWSVAPCPLSLLDEKWLPAAQTPSPACPSSPQTWCWWSPSSCSAPAASPRPPSPGHSLGSPAPCPALKAQLHREQTLHCQPVQGAKLHLALLR